MLNAWVAQLGLLVCFHQAQNGTKHVPSVSWPYLTVPTLSSHGALLTLNHSGPSLPRGSLTLVRMPGTVFQGLALVFLALLISPHLGPPSSKASRIDAWLLRLGGLLFRLDARVLASVKTDVRKQGQERVPIPKQSARSHPSLNS